MSSRDTLVAALDVMTIGEARAQLPQLAKQLAGQGAAAAPIFIGAHRRPTVVLLSIARYETLLDVLDNLTIALEVQRRDANDGGQRLTLDELLANLGITREDLAPKRSFWPWRKG